MKAETPEAISEALQKADPKLKGDLRITQFGKDYKVEGRIAITSFDTLAELAEAAGLDSDALDYVELSSNGGLNVIVQNDGDEGPHRALIHENGDPAPVKYTLIDDVPIRWIHEGETLKRGNPDGLKKLKNVVRKTRFVAPLILTDKLELIDGHLRLAVLKELQKEDRKADKNAPEITVPAVIVEADSDLATFLRLVVNRSSEFQRWDFNEVDSFADEHLSMTGYLEPYGIFSKNIVPKSFLGDTVKNYEISEYNDQQKFYSQSIGLAEWARRVRESELESRNKEAVKKAPKKPSKKNMKPFIQVPGDDE